MNPSIDPQQQHVTHEAVESRMTRIHLNFRVTQRVWRLSSSCSVWNRACVCVCVCWRSEVTQLLRSHRHPSTENTLSRGEKRAWSAESSSPERRDRRRHSPPAVNPSMWSAQSGRIDQQTHRHRHTHRLSWSVSWSGLDTNSTNCCWGKNTRRSACAAFTDPPKAPTSENRNIDLKSCSGSDRINLLLFLLKFKVIFKQSFEFEFFTFFETFIFCSGGWKRQKSKININDSLNTLKCNENNNEGECN